MTISEFMQEQPDDLIVHIGSGSSFLFVGTPVEWFENSYSLDIKQKESFRSRVEHRKDNIKRIYRDVFQDELLLANREKERLSVAESAKTLILNYFADCDYYKNWKPLFLREVLETYPRLQKDGIVAKIEGIESGNYWCREDFDNDTD